MSPQFIIEKWPHGWLICGASTEPRVPLDALSLCEPLAGKDGTIQAGIAHHYLKSGKTNVCMCFVSYGNDADLWIEYIEKSIADLPPQLRWWRGTDVGTSSASIFAVFCADSLKPQVLEFSHQSYPHDAGDFGRCQRLLARFPEWKTQLNLVAEAYPNTKWPAIIAKWDLIESASDSDKFKILSKI